MKGGMRKRNLDLLRRGDKMGLDERWDWIRDELDTR
jgi:hypothetical protein